MTPRYIILFAPNSDTICVVHEDQHDPDGWQVASRIRVFNGLASSVKFVSQNAFFAKLPYQIVELNLKEPS